MSTAASETVVHANDSAVPGLHNFRAVPGTARGTLYRSDSLDTLGVGGAEALARHGITLAVDMRSTTEARENPYAVPGLKRVAHSVALLEPGSPHLDDVTLASLYLRLVDEHGATLAAAVGSLARHDGPSLVHCTAGKDRTGVVVALTLLAAGLDRDGIVEDYARSHANLAGEWTDAYLSRNPALATLPPHLLEVVNASPAPVLERTIAHVEQTHGSAADYLLAHGLTSPEIDRLQRFVP